MKAMKQTALLFIGLTLFSNGCSSLRPPSSDREAWEEQQREAHPDNGWDIGMFGPVPIIEPPKSTQPPN
jgi:hypothetical protein